MTIGRPLKFETVDEFESRANEYFAKCDADEEPYTITGLALALDTFRSVLCDYEKRDEFSNAIKKAKQRVENDYEKALRKNGRAGDIFGLKNFGWRDKKELEHTGSVTLNFDKQDEGL